MIIFWHVNDVNTMMTTAEEIDTGVSTTQIDVEKIITLQDNNEDLNSFYIYLSFNVNLSLINELIY